MPLFFSSASLGSFQIGKSSRRSAFFDSVNSSIVHKELEPRHLPYWSGVRNGER